MGNAIVFDSTGPSGNIYAILGMVRCELRKQARINDFNEMRDRVFEASSYTNALSIIREYVELIDIRDIE